MVNKFLQAIQSFLYCFYSNFFKRSALNWRRCHEIFPLHSCLNTWLFWQNMHEKAKYLKTFCRFSFPPLFSSFESNPDFLDLNYILAITNLDIIYWDLLGWYWPNKINMIWKHFKNWKQCVLRVHQQMLYKTKAHGFSRFDILTYCIPLEFSLYARATDCTYT